MENLKIFKIRHMRENNKSKYTRGLTCYFLNIPKAEIIFKSVYTKGKHVNNINVIEKIFFYKLNEL